MAGQPTPVCPTPLTHAHVFTTNNVVQDYRDVALFAVADNIKVGTRTKAHGPVVANGPPNVTNRAFRSSICRTIRAGFRNPVIAYADVSRYRTSGGKLRHNISENFFFPTLLCSNAMLTRTSTPYFAVTYLSTWIRRATNPVLEDVVLVDLSMVSITVVPIHSDDIAVNARDMRTV